MSVFYFSTFLTLETTSEIVVKSLSSFFLYIILFILCLIVRVLDHIGSPNEVWRWIAAESDAVVDSFGIPKILSRCRCMSFNLKYIQIFRQQIITVGNKRSTTWTNILNTCHNVSLVILELSWLKHSVSLFKLGPWINWFDSLLQGIISYLEIKMVESLPCILEKHDPKVLNTQYSLEMICIAPKFKNYLPKKIWDVA